MSADKRIERDYLRLYRFLKRVLGRLRILRALEGGILLAAGGAIVSLTGLASLAARSFFPAAPFLVTIINLLLLASLVVLVTLRVVRVPSLSGLARQVEERFPDLKDNLTNSLALFHSAKIEPRRGDTSISLLAAQMAKTSRQVSRLSPGQIIEINQAARHLKLLLPLVLAFIGTWMISPSSLINSLGLLARPWASLPPRETYLEVNPKGAILAKGSRFLITASTWGKVPEEMTLKVWTEGNRESAASMEREGEGKFRYLLPSVDESFHYQAESRGYHSPVYRARVVPLPEIAELRLTYFPPEYSQLPGEVHSGGHISALKGTVVKFDITPTKEISQANLVLSETNLIPLKRQKNSKLTGNLIVLSEGSYHIALKDEFGFSNPSRLRYHIRLIPDGAPRVEIVQPAKDLEVIGHEIFPLLYKASDDFGITELRLGFRLPGKKEQKITLWKGPAQKRFPLKEFRWDLDGLALAPGDRLVYWLEVVDNDTISGPKQGYSQSLALIVKDIREELAKENQGIKEIADSLLSLLADHLEGPAKDPSSANQAREELARQAKEILKQVNDSLARFEKDRDADDPTRYDLKVLKRTLAATVERMESQEHESITPQLERMALLAEDMAKRARMEDVQALAQEIRNRERRLLSRLKELKDKGTEAGKAEALRELAKLQQLISKLMNALTKLADKLPDDFINSDALKTMEFQDMFQGLDRIARKLNQGDLKGALQAARELAQSLSQMLAGLTQAGMEARSAPFDRLRREMSSNRSELSRIITEQRKLLFETEELNKKLEKRNEALAAGKLGNLSGDIRAILNELEQILPRSEDEKLALEMERLLAQGKLGEFISRLKQMRASLGAESSSLDMSDSDRSASQSLALLDELKALMQRLDSKASELASDEEKTQLAELARREKSLQERTRSIKERLEILSQILPMMDPSLAEEMGQAAEFMGQARTRLGGYDPPGAIPPERQALERLAKSQQGMQALGRQLARRGGRQRFGWGFNPRAGWYWGGWRPLPTLPQPSLKGFRREHGYTGIEREEFRTPAKDAYQVPKMYREEVMKALKEVYPSQYQDQIKKYFQNLAD